MFIHRLFVLCIALLAIGCGSGMSYEEASKTAPYSNLSESDRRWLYDHHMTRAGALAWLEDEVNFLDSELQAWRTSDGKFELEHRPTGKAFAVPIDDAIALAQEKGGAAAAAELVARTREKVGGVSTPPQTRGLAAAFGDDALRAQKLRYPDLWRGQLSYTTDLEIKEARLLAAMGKKTEASSALQKAYAMRRDEFGESHEATQMVAAIHAKLLGSPLPGAPAPTIAAPEAEAEESPVDALLAESRAAWQAGDKAGSIAKAREAYALAQRSHGPEHPKSKEVLGILNRMAGTP